MQTARMQTDRQPSERSNQRCLFRDEATGIVIRRDFGIENDFFDEVRAVRRHGSSPVENFFDSYSYHYLLTHHEEPVGTMTMTQLVDGLLDCQDHYPDRLLHLLGNQIVSATKLRINPCECSSIKTLRRFIGCAFQDHFSLGCRLNLMNAEKKLVPFYRRMGFEVVKGFEFEHPILGTDSVVLVLAFDPDHRSFFQPIFASGDCPLSQAEAMAACNPIFDQEQRQSPTKETSVVDPPSNTTTEVR